MVLVLLLALLSYVASGTIEYPCPLCAVPLTRALGPAHIVLDELMFNVTIDEVDYPVSDVSCFGFNVTSVYIKLDKGTPADVFTLSLGGIQMSCKATMNDSVITLLPEYSAFSSLDMTWEFSHDPDSVYLLPQGLSVTNCSAGITFDTSLDEFQSYIPEALCDVWTQGIPPYGVYSAQILSIVIEPMLEVDQPIVLPPISSNTSVNWTQHHGMVDPVRKLAGTDITVDNNLLVNHIFSVVNPPDYFPFPNQVVPFQLDDVSNISITTENISGATTFSLIDVLSLVEMGDYPGDYSLGLSIDMEHLGAYLAGHLYLAPDFLFHSFDNSYIDVDYGVSVDLSHLSVDSVAQVSVNSPILSTMRLGQLLDSPQGCIPALLDPSTSITLLNLSVDEISVPEWSELDGFAPVMDEITSMIFGLFNGYLIDGLHGASATVLRDMANTAIVDLINSSICEEYVYNSTREIINFQESQVLNTIARVEELMSLDISTLGFTINNLVEVFTDMTGTVTGESLLDLNFSAPLDGIDSIRFSVPKASIHLLDSFNHFDIVTPVDVYSLFNQLGLDDTQVSLTVDYDIQGSSANRGSGIKNQFTVDVKLHNITGILEVFAEINVNHAKNLTMSRLFGYTGRNCALTVFESLSIEQILLSLQHVDVELDCVECNSAFQEWSKVLSTQDASFAITSAIAHVLETLLGTDVVDDLNNDLESAIDSSYHMCYTDPVSPREPGKGISIAVAVVTTLVVSALLAVGLYVFFRHRRSLRRQGRSSLSMREANDRQQSLSRSSDTPLWSRIVVPTLLVLNVGLFLSAHLTVGAQVEISAVLGSDELVVSAFAFSLGTSIHDMWQAGIYPLALLILIFSGVWPYVKSILLLVCWLTPPHVVNLKRRDTMLKYLDILGKWSLVDNYVLVLTIVAFSFQLETPVTPYLPAQLFSLSSSVVPGWGIYGFLIAAVLQLTVTHIIMYFHYRNRDSHLRYNIKEKEFRHNMLDESEPLLISPVIGDEDDVEDSVTQIQFTLWGKILISFSLLSSLVFVIAGSFEEFFSFTFRGVTGLILGDSASSSYSLVSVGNELLHQSSLGIYFIWFMYFFFALIIPVVQLLCLMVLWLVPMSIRVQKSLLFAVEMFRAWGALEVFIVSVLACLYELGQFVQFIIGDKCDEINEFLSTYATGVLHGETQCFNVTGSIEGEAYWVILVGAFLAFINTTFICLLCQRAILQRFNAIQEGKEDDQVLKAVRHVTVPLNTSTPVYRVLYWCGILKAVTN